MHLSNAINIYGNDYSWSPPVFDFFNAKKKRKARVAEVGKGDNKGEALATQTTMRPIEEEKRKAISRKMMREKKKGKGT